MKSDLDRVPILTNSAFKPVKHMLDQQPQDVEEQKISQKTINSGSASKNKLSAGLKDLSLRVMEEVIRAKQTTYSSVANQLIGILKQYELEDGDCDSDSELEAGAVEDKREKNVRRRVYDALNVQFAAGVLLKKGKYITPNYNCTQFKAIHASIKEREQCGDELLKRKQDIISKIERVKQEIIDK